MFSYLLIYCLEISKLSSTTKFSQSSIQSILNLPRYLGVGTNVGLYILEKLSFLTDNGAIDSTGGFLTTLNAVDVGIRVPISGTLSKLGVDVASGFIGLGAI